jgi:hypothetical protein
MPGRSPRTMRVEVAARPDPFLLRSAIEARLAERPLAPGPERAVADAVAAEVARARGVGAKRPGARPWR